MTQFSHTFTQFDCSHAMTQFTLTLTQSAHTLTHFTQFKAMTQFTHTLIQFIYGSHTMTQVIHTLT